MPSVLKSDPILSVPKYNWYNTVYQPVSGVPNITCAKVNQMYQNSLGMILSTDLIPSGQKCNCIGVPNVTTVTNLPKMTKSDPSVSVFGSVHFYMGFWKNPLLVP